MQLGEIIPNAVTPHPDAGTASDGEGMPPPIIVFRAELDINCDDGDFSNGEDQNDRDDGEEAEDVVVAGFVLPQGLEDEEELDEDYCEWNQSCKEDGLRATDVPGLSRYLAWESSSLGGMFPIPYTCVSVPGSEVHKWKLDAEPKHDYAD
jgi:hypothetical protein